MFYKVQQHYVSLNKLSRELHVVAVFFIQDINDKTITKQTNCPIKIEIIYFHLLLNRMQHQNNSTIMQHYL